MASAFKDGGLPLPSTWLESISESFTAPRSLEYSTLEQLPVAVLRRQVRGLGVQSGWTGGRRPDVGRINRFLNGPTLQCFLGKSTHRHRFGMMDFTGSSLTFLECRKRNSRPRQLWKDLAHWCCLTSTTSSIRLSCAPLRLIYNAG